MRVMAYDVTLELDGVESVVQLDDTYPSIRDWKTATEFAIQLARHIHPDVVHIDFVDCKEFRLEEFDKYDYVHEAPYVLQ